MKRSTLRGLQFLTGAAMGALIACSPTKFAPNTSPTSVCDETTTTCVVIDGFTHITQNFKVGAGKVDILFVNDNSASMAGVQTRMATAFSGFIENLDKKEIDYQIAMTTTEVSMVQSGGQELLSYANGKKVLTKADTARVAQFNSAIARPETAKCESIIKSYFENFGNTFTTRSDYAADYRTYCPSNDERGIYTAHEVISKNSNSFIRPDAHLNVIVISNEDVRSSLYRSSNPTEAANYALEAKDRSGNFLSMMTASYPTKYWQFNSIITKDSSCALQQQQQFTDRHGNPVRDHNNNYAIGANPGLEYAAISASATRDIDGNPAPRGQMISICETDFTASFKNIATKIAESARLMNLKCSPKEAPIVTGTSAFQWQGDKILFTKGSEGIPVTVKYKCNIGNAQ